MSNSYTRHNEIRKIRCKPTSSQYSQPMLCSDVEDGEIIDLESLKSKLKFKKRYHQRPHYQRPHANKTRKISGEKYVTINNVEYSEIDSYTCEENENISSHNRSCNLKLIPCEEKNLHKDDVKAKELSIPLNILKNKKRHSVENELNNIEPCHSKNASSILNNKHIHSKKIKVFHGRMIKLRDNQNIQSLPTNDQNFPEKRIKVDPQTDAGVKEYNKSFETECMNLPQSSSKQLLSPANDLNFDLLEDIGVKECKKAFETECMNLPQSSSQQLLSPANGLNLDLLEDFYTKCHEFREAYKQEIESIGFVCKLFAEKNEQLQKDLLESMIEIFKDKREEYVNKLKEYTNTILNEAKAHL